MTGRFPVVQRQPRLHLATSRFLQPITSTQRRLSIFAALDSAAPFSSVDLHPDRTAPRARRTQGDPTIKSAEQSDEATSLPSLSLAFRFSPFTQGRHLFEQTLPGASYRELLQLVRARIRRLSPQDASKQAKQAKQVARHEERRDYQGVFPRHGLWAVGERRAYASTEGGTSRRSLKGPPCAAHPAFQKVSR